MLKMAFQWPTRAKEMCRKVRILTMPSAFMDSKKETKLVVLSGWNGWHALSASVNHSNTAIMGVFQLCMLDSAGITFL